MVKCTHTYDILVLLSLSHVGLCVCMSGTSRSSFRHLLMHTCFVWQMMSQAEGQQRDLIRSIECLPVSGHLTSLDQDLLMLKATSMATMNCLNDCFHILQLQHASQQKGSLPAGECRCLQRAEPYNKYEAFLSSLLKMLLPLNLVACGQRQLLSALLLVSLSRFVDVKYNSCAYFPSCLQISLLGKSVIAA